MLIQNQAWDLITKGFSNNKIISISGISSTGKTSLVLYIVGNLLTLEKFGKGSCIWMQASEKFPKRRLETLFSYNPKKLNYLLENFFIMPQGNPCHNHFELLKNIKKITDLNFIAPPELKLIVIDNISHHLRYNISNLEDLSEKLSIINDFYHNYLLPLIFFCNREDLSLILIHEASSNIHTGKTQPFFHKLYDRIDTFQINLFKNMNSKYMEFIINDKHWAISYDIIETGFIWNFYL